MAKKPTSAQIDEAINPAVSEEFSQIAGKRVQVRIMYLRKEQEFLKIITRHFGTGLDDGVKVADIIQDLPVDDLAKLAVMVAANSGVDLTTDEILDGASLVEISNLILAQVNKNGYMDFLLRTAKALNLGRAL